MHTVIDACGFRALPSPRRDFVLFENPHALPRAYVVYRTELAPPADVLLSRLSKPDFDPMAASYVEAASHAGATASPHGHPATIVRDEPELVDIDATLDAPGLVVLADSIYPGWRATVDGAPATIVATNLLFRGVDVDAGAHRVRFEYRPASVAIGAAVSALGVLGMTALWIAGRR